MRDFNEWLSTFRNSISGYDYYVNFKKAYDNIDLIKVQLNIMNSLIGSNDIKADFRILVKQYPEILKCIPILIAKRELEIFARDEEGEFIYDFKNVNFSVEQVEKFMEKTGLFDLISNHVINNLVDYVTGVEVGLDSNGRKNRGGHQMEDLVESYIKKAGYIKDEDYFKEMTTESIKNKFNMDLAKITHENKTVKRFDFVIIVNNHVYAIETNFYTGGGSKLNETARSYKGVAHGSKEIENFTFIWITDGKGWISARNNLEETFDELPTLYSIHDMENGVLENLKNLN
ncbi:MAG: type II restriction endonuclease [Erysipelotrichaceae bacterium]